MAVKLLNIENNERQVSRNTYAQKNIVNSKEKIKRNYESNASVTNTHTPT